MTNSINETNFVNNLNIQVLNVAIEDYTQECEKKDTYAVEAKVIVDDQEFVFFEWCDKVQEDKFSINETDTYRDCNNCQIVNFLEDKYKDFDDYVVEFESTIEAMIVKKAAESNITIY